MISGGPLFFRKATIAYVIRVCAVIIFPTYSPTSIVCISSSWLYGSLLVPWNFLFSFVSFVSVARIWLQIIQEGSSIHIYTNHNTYSVVYTRTAPLRCHHYAYEENKMKYYVFNIHIRSCQIAISGRHKRRLGLFCIKMLPLQNLWNGYSFSFTLPIFLILPM